MVLYSCGRDRFFYIFFIKAFDSLKSSGRDKGLIGGDASQEEYTSFTRYVWRWKEAGRRRMPRNESTLSRRALAGIGIMPVQVSLDSPPTIGALCDVGADNDLSNNKATVLQRLMLGLKPAPEI